MNIKIDCVSDLHGHYPQLEGGDLLIVAGDLTAGDRYEQMENFCGWCLDLLAESKYKKIIWIAGNHDNWVQKNHDLCMNKRGYEYLCDSGTEFEYEEHEDEPHCMEGIVNYRQTFKIWGSPWTKSFPGMNPKAKAFTVDTEEELAEKWAKIPEDVDILVTHSPPFRVMDAVLKNTGTGMAKVNVGSTSLFERKKHLNNLKLWVFGHVHEGYGIKTLGQFFNPNYVNASHVNERYEPVNKPIRIEL